MRVVKQPVRDGSGAVLGVDLHVLVGQIGGPDRLTATTAAQFDADGDLFLGHYRRALLFGVADGTAATAGNAHVTEEYVDQTDIQLCHTSAAHGGEDASPVRIGSKQRGLDQRRMGYGITDVQALLMGCTAIDLHTS